MAGTERARVARISFTRRKTVRRILTVAAIGSLMAAGAMAESLSGTISDAKCGAKHADASESDAKCVQSCIRRGSAPVFVSGGKVYNISADSKDKVMEKLGQKVTVNGKLDGDTITIESVAAGS